MSPRSRLRRLALAILGLVVFDIGLYLIHPMALVGCYAISVPTMIVWFCVEIRRTGRTAQQDTGAPAGPCNPAAHHPDAQPDKEHHVPQPHEDHEPRRRPI